MTPSSVPVSQTAAGNYMGRQTTGRGAPIPVNPQTGQLDINALIGQMVDRRKTYVYDTLKLAPGTTVSNTPYRFFQTPIGQQDPYNGNVAKTELETNMRSTGMFNPPYDMIINNLGFLFLAGNRVFDIEQIVNLGWFEFKILEKTMWMGHLWRHPPGAGLTGFSTRTTEAVWNNGNPAPDKVWLFRDYKKYIPPLVNFSLTLNFPETYNTYYNSSLPNDVTTVLGSGIGGSLPTLSSTASGGNGIQIIAFMNGLSDGPVQ
jgi:hypothetical protein